MSASATATATLGTSRASSRRAFGALLHRDIAVLGKDKWMFIGRTVMQPLLLARWRVGGAGPGRGGGGGSGPSLASWGVSPPALFTPATPVHLNVHWFRLITLLPLAAMMSAAFGLTIGTRVEPRQVPLIF